MPTARSYDRYSLDGEPFKENGRMYVYVMTLTGNKKVRWYTDAERAAQDRKAGIEPQKKDLMDFDARAAFGFEDEGYITIYKGRNVEEWAENDRRNIYYNNTFLYYTPGGLTLPTLSDGIIPIKLSWNEVVDHGTKMKSHEEVRKYVDCLLAMDKTGASQYQGNKDEWIQKTVKVRKKESRDSRYGTKYTYSLEDAENNTYIWETGAKDYPCDTTVSLKMKVKEHKEVNGEKCTVVWYCKEI